MDVSTEDDSSMDTIIEGDATRVSKNGQEIQNQTITENGTNSHPERVPKSKKRRKNNTSAKSPSKWSKYSKKFKVEWLHEPELAQWVERDEDITKAVCKFCNTQLRAHKSDLRKHMSSSKHKKSMSLLGVRAPNAPVVLNIPSGLKDKFKQEICLAAYAGCHSTGTSIVHLIDICNKFLESKESIELDPAKCAFIVKSIIAPHLLEEILTELYNTNYSLILWESTDISCKKYLCVCVRYFSKERSAIMSQFLGLLPFMSPSASTQYEELKVFLNENGLSFSKCLGIAIDGASNLSGNRFSLFSLIKNDVPGCYLIKCIPYSLQLACSVATKELPVHIDYMIRETYNWFQRSAMMKEDYNILYNALNDKDDILQLIPLAGNQWLARSQCVKRILEQYDNLKMHFAGDIQHDRYLSEQLRNMYNDPYNKLYLTFLKPILQEFEDVNKIFQEEILDFCTVLSKLEKFVLKMFQRIISVGHISLNVNLALDSIYLPIDKVDYGYEFLSMIMDLMNKGQISHETALAIRENCFLFLKEACQQLQMRIPDNMDFFRKFENLSPSICLSHTRPPFAELPLEFADKSKLDLIEAEWQQLLYVDWRLHFGTVPKDGQTFWSKAASALDEEGAHVLKHLSEFALIVYSLPVSNAIIERIFSKVSALKMKLGNRVDIELLTALLRVKSCISGDDDCCFGLEPSNAMIKKLHLSKNVNLKPLSEDGLDTINTFYFDANYNLHL